MALAVGDHLDRYVIEALIGEGGMGRVYRAYDEHLHRFVALKVLRTDDLGQVVASAAGRLLREARAAAALDHPNAVSVFDAGELDGTIYIAMEYVDGTSLRAFVPPHGTASPELRLRWLVDVARALAAAHDRGLVHRDVKPENVLVRKDSVVKVLDFGIAKRVGVLSVDPESPTLSPEDAMQTASGTLVGTPRYMSPEQVRGEVVDGRSDQFSWGVLAYELLSGDIPWVGATDGPKLFAAVAKQVAAPLSVAGLPKTVSDVVLRVLEKRAVDRFPSMHDVVGALEPLLHASASLPRLQLPRIDPRSNESLRAATLQEPLPSPPARPLTRPVRWVGALAVALATTVMAWRSNQRAATSAPTSASASAIASAAPPASTIVGDAPLPLSVKTDAAAAYRAGMQAFRDASFDATRQSLERATTLDATFGAAHLRLALMRSLVSAEEQEARHAFKNAIGFRATMDERDQQVLDAFEPYFQRDPSDFVEAEARMAKVAAARPGDAEAWFWLGYVRFDRGRLPEALEAFTRASTIDPRFALALSNQGGILAYLGRFTESRAALDRCLAVSPAATDCLWYRVLIAEQDGRCADADADLRTWIAKDADDFYAYQMLAKTLFAEGKAESAVLEAYEQKWRRQSDERRPRSRPFDLARLDIMAGRFEAAEAHLHEMERAVASEPGALAHAAPAQLLAQLYEETGRTAKARDVARGFLDRREAWTQPHRVDDNAISEDVTPSIEGTLARTGGMPLADQRAHRDAWLDRWKSRTTGAYVGYLWVFAYAEPASTREAAEEALTALPSLGPLPPFFPQNLASAHVAKVYALAERWAEARPLLERASKVCLALEDPLIHTQTLLRLGQAREATGDAEAACAAYDAVIARWGKARPASLTARKASARRAGIGCR
jgi:serine/threonine-protein kinase